MRGTSTESGRSRLHDVAWGLWGLAALMAPWLLGGRADAAPWIIGGLAWLAVPVALAAVMADQREWRYFAEVERRRGAGSRSPLRKLGTGLLWTLPLWLFLGLLLISLLNPAYAWEGNALMRQDFLPALPTLIDPLRSQAGIYLLGGLIAAAALLANPAVRLGRATRKALLIILLGNAMVLCWMGLAFAFAGSAKILGRFEPVAGYFFATFYYKNHWAAYALLYCGVAAVFLFRDLPRWFSDGRRAGSGGLALLCIFFLGLTFPVANTRSGILLFVLFGIACLAGLYRGVPGKTGKRLVIGAALLGGASFAALSVNELQHNWERTQSQVRKADSVFHMDGIRTQHAPEVCLAMVAARPLWGWGYLSYDPLFPVYATDYFRDEQGRLLIDMEFAHNDWLQAVVEFGMAGTALLALGLAGLVIAARQPGAHLRQRRWILLGIGLLGLFACWDFPFSNPAVLTNAAVLLLLAIKGRPQKS